MGEVMAMHYVLDDSTRMYEPMMFPGIALGTGGLACGKRLVVWQETTDWAEVTCPDCLARRLELEELSVEQG